MPFNGSGTFSPLTPPTYPAVDGDVIQAAYFNSVIDDILTGLSSVITKDGQTTVTANIPMNSFKFTGLAAGTASGNSINYTQWLAAFTTPPVHPEVPTLADLAATVQVINGNYLEVAMDRKILAVSLPNQTGNSGKFIRTDGATASWQYVVASDINSGEVAVARGGTGIASYAIGDLLYASGATTLSKLADVAAGSPLVSGGVGVAPAYGQIPVASAISGFAAGMAGFLGAGTSLSLLSAMTDETGTGSLVFATNPVLVTPNLGTPSTLVLTNATGTPASLVGTNITGTGAGFTAGTATVANGLKSATTTVSVSAATAPSANQVLTATNSTTATWVTPTASTTRLDQVLAANTTATISNGDNAIVWRWSVSTASKIGFNITESAASAGANSVLFQVNTLANSTADVVLFAAEGNTFFTIEQDGVTRVGTGTAATGTVGALVHIRGQQGGTTFAGGAVNINGGAGGTTSGAGGAISITAGSGSGTTASVGGALNLTAGSASIGTGTAVGGALTITSGSSDGAAAGAISITGGTGFTGGTGGTITIAAGASDNNAGSDVTISASSAVLLSNSAGGNLNLNTGAATGTGIPGELKVNTVTGINDVGWYQIVAAQVPVSGQSNTFFIANRACRIQAASIICSSAGTVPTATVRKETGTTAPGSGTNVLTAAMTFSATANTRVTGTRSATVADYTLAAGDRLSVTWGGTVGAITGAAVAITLNPC